MKANRVSSGQQGVAVKKHDSTRTTTVTEQTQVSKVGLAHEEERLLRMRSGASLAPGERLGSKLDGVKAEHRDEVAARLALMEAEILAALDANPELRTDRKQRIVDALRESDTE